MKVYQHRSNQGFLWTNHLMQCNCTHELCVKLMKVFESIRKLMKVFESMRIQKNQRCDNNADDYIEDA